MYIRSNREKGISVIIVAAGLTTFIGFLALVVDLGMLFASRSDAQKAADAAALAGARYFIDQGAVPGSLTSQMRDESRAFAKAIGSQNKIRGVNVPQADVIVNDSDILLLSTPNGPVFQVTALVQRNALSTYFANILGVGAVNISASATAQASLPVGNTAGAPPSYNPGAKCIKPWMVQNVSPRTTDPNNPIRYGPDDFGTVVYLHDDQSTNGPSKWGIIAPCPTYTPPPTEPCDGGNSSPVYYDNIVKCNPNTYYCSEGVWVSDVPGNKVGKTQDGVQDLIHQGGGKNGEGTDQGQDTISGGTPGPNYNPTITGGSNNPNPLFRGQPITATDSDSVIVVPVTNLPPPSNGQIKMRIDGLLKLFITQVHPPNAKPKSAKNQIDTIILGYGTCDPGAGGGSNGNPQISGGAGGFQILRLVK